MNRAGMLQRMREHDKPWDFMIVGGGATGVGLAVDAASRGFSVLLLEQHDFGKGTSSRSTKLVHGGVRYLEQGNISLVMEALHERALMRENAPHVVHDLSFVVPTYNFWEAPFYGLGLKIYDYLSGRAGFGSSVILPGQEVLRRIPTIKKAGLRRGVLYHDGQFDDSRLLINLVRTAADQGAVLLNYARVTGLSKDAGGKICGATATDLESGEEFSVQARTVINATGAFTDSVRRMSQPQAENMVTPSQGVHLVFSRELMPGDTAIMVPHTSDGRVMFVIPWHDHVLVGTTDTAIESPSLEPRPLEQEIDFILGTAALYLERPPSKADILSVFVGIRPLVKASGATKSLSRDHTIVFDQAGLMTICGGKWTTYRRMAKDGIDKALAHAGLPAVSCRTDKLRIHGYHENAASLGELALYGADAQQIRNLVAAEPALGAPLHTTLPFIEAEVVFAVRQEMCRTVEDFLARRVRALFLNAGASAAMAPRVAQIMAAELGHDAAWQAEQVKLFNELAAQYSVSLPVNQVGAARRS